MPEARDEPPPSNELRALGRLAFDELGGVPAGIGQLHRAIAERAFWGVRAGVGPAARPVRAAHDAVARRVYGGLREGTVRLGAVADSALARRQVGEDLLLSATRPGAALVAALNGLIGDTLERAGSPLHQPAAVRVGGRPVEPAPDELRDAFPDATPRLVVFLHGLMETEFSWSLGADQRGQTYGTGLRDDLDATPIYVRYNTGRHVSENGHEIAELLERLVAAWPVEVREIALVGHSMGGLVARSACHQAAAAGRSWVTAVRHVVSLGTPHMGAPLEEAAHAASALLHALPETRPMASFLRRRSAGIRDLRRGSLVDEDWRDRDPDALRAAACREVPLLEGATHCFVSATITRSERHPLGRIVGDCLVLAPSASGRSRRRRIPFRAEDGMHLGGAHHFALLNHPAVYDRLRSWLANTPAPVSAPG